MEAKTNSVSLNSVWLDTAPKAPTFKPLVEDISADVCVVGAGIAGITTAYLLQKAGKKVVLVEAHELVAGESSRTTAHLVSALDDGFAHLQNLFGKDGARLAIKSHKEAIDLIEKIIKEEKIDCDFSRVDGYLISVSPESRRVLAVEYPAAREDGFDDVEEATVPVGNFATNKAIKFPNQGQFHPLKYLYALTEAFLAWGGQVFTETYIEKVEEKDEQVIITSKSGKMITAKYCAVTTNMPFIDRYTMPMKEAAFRTYVIALEIPKGSVPVGLYWDMADPYHYVRTYAHGHTDFLIVGGEDHRTGQDSDSEGKFNALETWAKEHFLGVSKRLNQWSGQILEPIDSLAFLGLNPGSKRTYIVTGDSGHGLTHGTLGANLICDLIMGKENPYTKLYDPARKNIHALKQFMKNGLNVTKEYFSNFFSSGIVKSEEEIKPGTGAVLSQGMKKIAVYKDHDGKVYRLSPICTHLGCIVDWNEGEKTWDCPCHGSRYSAQGEVINGPAMKDLEKLS